MLLKKFLQKYVLCEFHKMGVFNTLCHEAAWWGLAGIFGFITICFTAPPGDRKLLALPVILIASYLFQNRAMCIFYQKSGICCFFNSSQKPSNLFSCFILLSVYYILLIRAGYFNSTDTIWQWEQVLAFHFSDWHPATHTFCIWLITCVCRSYIFFLFVQACLYALLVLTCYRFLLNYCHIKKYIATASLAVIALHPAMTNLLLVAWKDTAMAVAFSGIVICLIGITMTEGKWLQSNYALLGFVSAVSLGTLFRHNAFFFTLPLLATLFLWIRRSHLKRYITAVVLVLCIVSFVKFIIIPSTCNAPCKELPPGAKLSQTYWESIGIPMAVLGTAAKYHPEKLPSEVRAFLLKAAPLEIWQTYEMGNANSIKYLLLEKWHLDRELSMLPPVEFLKMTIKTAVAVPSSALWAVVYQTGEFWKLNSWPGFYVALLLFTGLWVFPVLKWKILPLTLPIFCYQTGTSLLMYSKYDIRFFLYTIPVCLPLALLLLSLCHKEMEKNAASREY